jgi:hypothetical protein
MSAINEDKIRERLEALSKAEPAKEATDRAMQKVRDALTIDRRVGSAHRNVIGGQSPPYLTKLAAAAVLMIGLGYLGGRLSAPAPVDTEQLRADIEDSLRASLEPAIKKELLEEMDTRWDSTFAARSAELKDEFQKQVRRDLMEFAGQTLAYANNRTDERLAELARVIHEARVQDRQRTAEGFKHLESNIEKGLVTLAARTNEIVSTQ